MTPYQTWNANKGRVNLRLYTREFQKKFVSKTTKLSEVSNVYAMSYKMNSEKPTDKHHVMPIIMSFGRFRNYNETTCVRGLNLMFLSNSEIINLMEKVYSFMKFKPDERVAGMIKLHEECMMKFPYAFHNFEEQHIAVLNEIDKEEWGMIPLLHRHLFGNFNTTALKKDYLTEHAKPVILKRKPKVKKEQTKPEVETVSEEWSEGDIGFDLDDDI